MVTHTQIGVIGIRLVTFGPLLIAIMSLAGCSALGSMFKSDSDAPISNARRTEIETLPDDPAPDSVQEVPRGKPLSLQELRERNRALADRYRVVLGGAVDTIMQRRDDPLLRRKAHQLKIDGATAVYDIVVDPSPQSALLNLLVQITLQKKLSNATAAAECPDDHPLIESKVEQLYDEVWSHAALVMDERERMEMLAIIDRWWSDHGGDTGIWYVRLSDLAGYGRGTSLEGIIGSARGLPSQLLNSLVPLSDASQSLDEITAVSESATWFAPRLLVLSQWRLEAIIFEALATTELTNTVAAIARLSETASTLPEDVGREVTSTIDALADREPSLSPLLDRTEAVLAAASSTTNEGTELMQAVGHTSIALTDLSESLKPLINTFSSDGESSVTANDDATESGSFDITQYTETARALEGTLEEASALLARIDTTADAEALRSRAQAVSGQIGMVVLYISLGAIAVILSVAGGVIAVRKVAPRGADTARVHHGHAQHT